MARSEIDNCRNQVKIDHARIPTGTKRVRSSFCPVRAETVKVGFRRNEDGILFVTCQKKAECATHDETENQ